MARDNPREGDVRLSAKDKATDKADTTPQPKRKSRDDQLGRALKTVYDDTLREDVPDEFSDLLKKLG